jgi:crotonobetainyl-CoA:carnitine CoA-transferase CaiB-like acyl-CoA transferase
MSEAREQRPGALEGVRVIEIAQVMAIPMAGLVLADMGADVIKVEPPHGDSFRSNQSQIYPGESKGFTIYNRGKRSVCIDLTRPEASTALEPLLQSADVVLVSMKPTDVPRYGVTYEHCAKLKPDVIYLDHIPLGPRGPFADDGGYDVVVQGMSGLGTITARSNGDAAMNVRPAYADTATGFLSALAVVAALRHRDKTGEGQRVETSLLSTALALGGNLLHWFAATDPPVWDQFHAELADLRTAGASFDEQRALYERRILAGGHGNIYFRHYRTADGFVSVGSLSPGLNSRLRQVTGLKDPRIESGFDLNSADAWDRLTRFVREAEDLFRTNTTRHWIDTLHAAGVPCGPFNFPTEVFNDPQVLANEYLIELEHPTLGAYKTFAPPIRMDATPTRVRAASPLLGEHTLSVLGEAGISGVQLEHLTTIGVLGAATPL